MIQLNKNLEKKKSLHNILTFKQKIVNIFCALKKNLKNFPIPSKIESDQIPKYFSGYFSMSMSPTYSRKFGT